MTGSVLIVTLRTYIFALSNTSILLQDDVFMRCGPCLKRNLWDTIIGRKSYQEFCAIFLLIKFCTQDWICKHNISVSHAQQYPYFHACHAATYFLLVCICCMSSAWACSWRGRCICIYKNKTSENNNKVKKNVTFSTLAKSLPDFETGPQRDWNRWRHDKAEWTN